MTRHSSPRAERPRVSLAPPVAVGEIHVDVPVVWREVVLAGPQVVGDAAFLKRRLWRREAVRDQSLLPIQLPRGRGEGSARVFAFRSGPGIPRRRCDADEAWRNQCDELVLVHAPGRLGVDVTHVVAAEPVVETIGTADDVDALGPRQGDVVELRGGEIDRESRFFPLYRS